MPLLPDYHDCVQQYNFLSPDTTTLIEAQGRTQDFIRKYVNTQHYTIISYTFPFLSFVLHYLYLMACDRQKFSFVMSSLDLSIG